MKLNNIDKATEYYFMSIKHKNKYAMNNLIAQYKQIYPTHYNLKVYIVLASIQPPNELITNKLRELESDPEIIHYKNKLFISQKYNIVDECFICYTHQHMIPLTCGHVVCTDCYIKINKCPYNCK